MAQHGQTAHVQAAKPVVLHDQLRERGLHAKVQLHHEPAELNVALFKMQKSGRLKLVGYRQQIAASDLQNTQICKLIHASEALQSHIR